MLVLSRQKNEAIMIGDDVEVIIVDIRGDRVRLGITAPQKIPVHRKEVYEAIRRENIEASRAKVEDLSQIDRLLTGAAEPPQEKDERAEGGREKEEESEA